MLPGGARRPLQEPAAAFGIPVVEVDEAAGFVPDFTGGRPLEGRHLDAHAALAHEADERQEIAVAGAEHQDVGAYDLGALDHVDGHFHIHVGLVGRARGLAHLGVDHPAALLQVIDEAVTSLGEAGIHRHIGVGFLQVTAFAEVAVQGLVIHTSGGGGLDVGQIEEDCDSFHEHSWVRG